jgi:hypothetical protein
MEKKYAWRHYREVKITIEKNIYAWRSTREVKLNMERKKKALRCNGEVSLSDQAIYLETFHDNIKIIVVKRNNGELKLH